MTLLKRFPRPQRRASPLPDARRTQDVRWPYISAALLLLFAPNRIPAQAAERDLFVVDVSTDRVLQIDGETGALVRTVAAFAQFDNPRTLLFQGGDLLVGLDGLSAARINRYRFTGGVWSNLGALATSVTPTEMAAGPDGLIYWASFQGDNVWRTNPANGASGQFTPFQSGGVDGAASVLFAPNGSMWVSSSFNNRLVKFNGPTQPSPAAPAGMVVGVSCCGVTKSVVGPDGFIYQTGFTSSVFGNGAIFRVNPDTGATSVFAGGLNSPASLTFGPDGNLYAGDGNIIKKFDGLTGASLGNFSVLSTSVMQSPWDLTFAPGPLLSAPVDDGNGVEFRLDVTEILGRGVQATNLGALHRLYVDSFGGVGLAQDSNSITRSFVFSRQDGLSDPQVVGLFGSLEGLLHADLGGNVLTSATISLKDQFGNPIASDAVSIPVSASLSQTIDVNVLEELKVSAMLTPGTTYRLTSTLSASANGGATGRGFADFRNTFEVQLSGVPEPPASLLFLLGIGAAAIWRRRDG
ncbi:MAG: PEP-CTERM sorting domain-containing protein [Pirellulales bacterium]